MTRAEVERRLVSRKDVHARGRRRVMLLAATWLLLMGSAAVQRFTGLDRLLWGSDELGNLFLGIRLHLLQWWNLGDHVRANFFKSLVMGVHGLGDTVFFYVVVAVFRVLHIPVTEAHLFQAQAGLSLVTLVLLFCFVRRLFGAGVAFVVLALAAWNPLLIFCAKNGYQMTFVIFLLVAILYGYVLHVSKNRWPVSLLQSVLMALCAGSELFYLAPVLLMLHAASRRAIMEARDRRSAGQGTAYTPFLDRKNLVVWAAYGLMLLVDLFLFFKVGRQVDLTVFGRLSRKRAVEIAMRAVYGPKEFFVGLGSMVSWVPSFGVVACLSAAWLLLTRARRDPWVQFAVGYFTLVSVLTYVLRFVHAFNLMHLLIPAFLVLAVAAVRLAAGLISRIIRPAGERALAAGIVCVVALLPLAAPWKIVAGPSGPPKEFQCVKAVGAVLRDLGRPDAGILMLSHSACVPTAMEYYVGLSASQGDGTPPRLLYLPQMDDEHLPRRLAARMGVKHFDYYVDFVHERFAGKERCLADLQDPELRLVAEVTSNGEVCARIYSPRALRPVTVSVEEGNRRFDRTYARWGRLFTDPYAGVFYYFGSSY